MLHSKEPLHNSFSYKNRNTAICERVQADDRILITNQNFRLQSPYE